ncbi:hypothetical protein [Streptomyces viridochromogenes]|uniref:hypothetical protein n=1 Tax=Streptomyces viridochromogenes TaxID=1938 RepID=UPI00056599D9|nr:hypothetical protein [Streptomyces viridochromogenes]
MPAAKSRPLPKRSPSSFLVTWEPVRREGERTRAVLVEVDQMPRAALEVVHERAAVEVDGRVARRLDHHVGVQDASEGARDPG